MNWILLSLISAVLLGLYDVAKKLAVRDNAVPMVLLAAVSIAACLYAPLIIWSALAPESIGWSSFVVEPLSWQRHGLLCCKSALVGASWTFAYSALKHLPLSIAAPIRATSPLWTILIATLFFGERPSWIQWTGMAIVLFGFWRFTLVGRREGIRFTRDPFVGLMVMATLLGSCSAIYDKWLLQIAKFDPVTMQAWFSVYLVPVMIPLAVRWYRRDCSGKDRSAVDSSGDDSPGQAFHWRLSILVVSPLLLVADWFYFVALTDENAMVSIVSVIRRTSVVIALAFGARALSEANFRAKAVCVGVILGGVVLLTWHG